MPLVLLIVLIALAVLITVFALVDFLDSKCHHPWWIVSLTASIFLSAWLLASLCTDYQVVYEEFYPIGTAVFPDGHGGSVQVAMDHQGNLIDVSKLAGRHFDAYEWAVRKRFMQQYYLGVGYYPSPQLSLVRRSEPGVERALADRERVYP